MGGPTWALPQCWTGIIFCGYRLGICNEDFMFFDARAFILGKNIQWCSYDTDWC